MVRNLGKENSKGGRSRRQLETEEPSLTPLSSSPLQLLTGCFYKPTLWDGDPSGLSLYPQNVSTRKPIKLLPSCFAKKDHIFHTT
jgi:hypothetical protein